MIEVTNLTKQFDTFKAVDNLSFKLNAGDVVGFLGPNGAGKTTTMRLITGFLTPTSGTCTIEGLDVASKSLAAREKMGYLPESSALYNDMEVSDYLKTMGTLRKMSSEKLKSRLDIVIEQCGLKPALGKKIATLSKGYRQRTGLAQALLHDPPVLILDEPTVGLDPNQMSEIRNLIRNIGKTKTILLSTHILSEVEQTCGRVIIITDGKIAGEGSPQELMRKNEGGSSYYVVLQGKKNESDFIKLPHFISAQAERIDGDKTRVHITLDSHEDKSAEIFKLAVANNWVLSELWREEATLEDVFKKLTR